DDLAKSAQGLDLGTVQAGPACEHVRGHAEPTERGADLADVDVEATVGALAQRRIRRGVETDHPGPEQALLLGAWGEENRRPENGVGVLSHGTRASHRATGAQSTSAPTRSPLQRCTYLNQVWNRRLLFPARRPRPGSMGTLRVL